MSIYKLYASQTGDSDAVAQLDVQFDGTIVAWSMSARCSGMGTDGDNYNVEVSFLSANMIASNDARGVIAVGRKQLSLTTSGAYDASLNQSLAGLRIPVVAGERIYMHYTGTAGNACVMDCILYVEDSANVNLRRRR